MSSGFGTPAPGAGCGANGARTTPRVRDAHPAISDISFQHYGRECREPDAHFRRLETCVRASTPRLRGTFDDLPSKLAECCNLDTTFGSLAKYREKQTDTLCCSGRLLRRRTRITGD